MPKLLTILLTFTLFLSGCILVGQRVSQPEPQPEQVATSTSDEIDTSDWKTYRNEEYGFEFRYPKDWLMEKNAGINFKPSIVSITGPETRKVIDEAEGSGGYCEGCGPNISFYHHQALTDISGYDVTSITELVAKDPTYTKLGTRKIGELSMTEMRVGGLGSYYDLIIDRGEKGIFEIFFGWAEGPDELTETENQILSTFKFIY
jgi:hypothetical protein